MIVAQAFQATPREHAPAVVVGLLPGIGAWGALMAKNGLRAAGLGGTAGPFSESLVGEFQKSDTWIHGAFAIEQGFLFTAMILSAAVVGVIRAAMDGRRSVVRVRRAPVGVRPDALVSVDLRRYRDPARTRVAVRDRLRRHGAALLHGAVDDGRRRRAH